MPDIAMGVAPVLPGTVPAIASEVTTDCRELLASTTDGETMGDNQPGPGSFPWTVRHVEHGWG